MEPDLGERFANALAAKDFDRAAELLAPQVDFRAMTPNRFWEASSAGEVAAEILPLWLEDTDHIDQLASVETAAVGDCERVAYVLHGHNADGPFVVEQQAYFTADRGRIGWMRVLCSGFRPVSDG